MFKVDDRITNTKQYKDVGLGEFKSEITKIKDNPSRIGSKLIFFDGNSGIDAEWIKFYQPEYSPFAINNIKPAIPVSKRTKIWFPKSLGGSLKYSEIYDIIESPNLFNFRILLNSGSERMIQVTEDSYPKFEHIFERRKYNV